MANAEIGRVRLAQIGQDRDEAYATVTALEFRGGDPPIRIEIAGTVLWLLGPQAGYVDGASVVADGGTTVVDPGTAAFDFTVTPRGWPPAGECRGSALPSDGADRPYLRLAPRPDPGELALAEHQAQFLQWLAELCQERQVDAILVSGDIYDRAVPSVEAVQLLEAALGSLPRICSRDDLRQSRLGGPARLRRPTAGVGGPALACQRRRHRAGHPADRGGWHDDPGLRHPLPRPQLARGLLGCAKSHAAVLTAAMDLVRADLAERAAAAAASSHPRSIVMAHAFITGGRAAIPSGMSASAGWPMPQPRSSTGWTPWPSGTCTGRRRSRGSSATLLRYSGSPLAYSFSEESHRKSITILDIPTTGPIEVELVPAPAPRGMRTITGDLADLLADPALAEAEQDWIRAIVTTPSARSGRWTGYASASPCHRHGLAGPPATVSRWRRSSGASTKPSRCRSRSSPRSSST
jgi:exonuclease SbcD